MQYIACCGDDEVEVKSHKTYMRVLQAIGPRVRKSMQGLDNYAADKAQAFDDLKALLPLLKIENGASIIDDSKHYLKSDYKVCIISVLR